MTQEHADNVIAFGGNTAVYDSIKRFSVQSLNALIRHLMDNADDSLFDLSEKVENDSDRNMYFEAMREIRKKRQAIIQGFDLALQQNFREVLTRKNTAKKPSGFDELSLVDQQELEDDLAIQNMISKARPHFEDELFGIHERLKVTLHRPRLSDRENPLDPSVICESFHEASNILETDIKVKLIFYKLFDKFVLAGLGGFYREVNDLFVQKGVLPDFHPEKERLNQTSRFMAGKQERNRSAGSQKSETTNSGASSNTSAVPGVPEFAMPGDGNVLSVLQRGMTQGVFPASPVISAGTVSAASTSDSSMPPVGFASAPSAVNPVYLEGLSQLQANLPEALRTTSVGTTADPQQIKQSLQQQLVGFKEQYAASGSSSDNQVIDIVSMLFDFFFDDTALPDPIKVLIGRLQIPILKVAILDPDFFNLKKHPARQLLDQISKAAMGWGDDADKEKLLVAKLEEVVDYLLQEFDKDVSVFEQALQQFKSFLQQLEQQAEQEKEQVLHREKARDEHLLKAREITDQLINKLVSRHELSFDVTDFLQGIWRSVLYNTFVTQGEDSAHWKNLKKITMTLLWTLIPKQDEVQRQKLLKTLPALLRSLSKGMELVNVPMENQNRIFKMLVVEHAKVVKQSSKNLVTREDDKTVWPEQGIEAAFAEFNQPAVEDEALDIEFTPDDTGELRVIDQTEDAVSEGSMHEVVASTTEEVVSNLDEFTESVKSGDIQVDEEIVLESSEAYQVQQAEVLNQDDDVLEVVENLPLDSWVEFDEPGGQKLLGRLFWKSKVTGKFVFVNKAGEKIKNSSLTALVAEIRLKQARIIVQTSFFDRALGGLMSRFKPA